MVTATDICFPLRSTRYLLYYTLNVDLYKESIIIRVRNLNLAMLTVDAAVGKEKQAGARPAKCREGTTNEERISKS